MVQLLLIYLLKVIVCSGVFILYYWFALRNRRFHYYNRFYLLLSVLLSALLPLTHLQLFSFNSRASQTIHLFNIINARGEQNIFTGASNQLDYQQLVLFTAAFICIVMVTLFAFGIKKIYTLKRKYPVNILNEFDFINTDIQQAPFSFLKNIFWRNDISLQEETGKQILQHEITHIKQKHSWDKLFIEIVLCFYWSNPFFWLIQKELYLIHEFIADEEALDKTDTAAFAKMLLASQYGKFQFSPAQSIFYSPIKRRLIMLTTSNKPQFSYLRRLMILPLLAVVICLFSFTIKNGTGNSIIKISAPFKLVVDAGHGGKDYGASGNGLYEKNITLKIAEKMKELSPQYGIDVVLTRDNDVYMSPQEKSNFANSQNANAFISIHVNADEKDQYQQGFEILLAKNNAQTFSSSLFGSAILQSLQPSFKTAPSLLQQNEGVWVLKNSMLPAALIECGYITNANDAKNLNDDAKIELMAKDILHGVFLYANNQFDYNNILPNQQSNSKDTTVPQKSNSMVQPQQTPLYVLDGKIIKEEEFKNVSPDDIESIYVLKDKDAIDKYGDKGKYGVIEIALKSNKEKRETQEPAPPPPPPAPPVKVSSVILTSKDTLVTTPAKVIAAKPYPKTYLVKSTIKKDTLVASPAKVPSIN